jgi:ParB-like chromosome segregation protein Spo0J
LADRLRISPATLSQSLAMLGLPPEIQESVDEGRIAPNAAWQLTKVEDPAERAALAKEAEAGRLKRDDLQQATRAARKASPKGRGASNAKACKVTSRVIRTPSGPRITIEFRRGLDDETIRKALAEAMGQLGGEGEGRGEAAA